MHEPCRKNENQSKTKQNKTNRIKICITDLSYRSIGKKVLVPMQYVFKGLTIKVQISSQGVKVLCGQYGF